MPDPIDPNDCQGNTDCLTAQAACTDEFDTEVSAAQDREANNEADCQQAFDASLLQCESLDPSQQGPCVQEITLSQDRCVRQAKSDRDTDVQVSQVTKAFCFSEAARKFLNSSRNSGKKRKPGTNGCLPCTLPDCSQFVTDCKATLSSLDTIIQMQRSTGTPDPNTTLSQVQAIVKDYLAGG